MKNKKLLLKINVIVASILILSIIILMLLGKKERIGYLSEFKLNVNKTLEINGLDINKTKQLFTIDNKLDESAITKYILTNNSITNYNYNFRIKYYSKVFRNSDIYRVYPNLSNLPEYVQSAKMNDDSGTPFGNLISTKVIDFEKIDNVNYVLKLKNNLIIIHITLLIILLIFICFIYKNNICDFFTNINIILIKNKIFISRICFIIIAVLIISIILLAFLGKKERVGYLSEFKLNVNKTLEINGLDINKTKQLFTIDNKLDNTAITNYIFTNDSITNYSYDFRIKYYSKLFRHGDVYGVYPNLSNLPEYVQSAKMGDNDGTPFGDLVSSKIINTNKIDNINYILKLKNNFVLINIVILIMCLLCTIFNKVITNFNKIIIKIMISYFKSINKKNIYNIIFIIIIFIIAFTIMATIHPRYIPFKVVVISDKEGIGNVNSISWKTKYGFNELQKYNFNENEIANIKYYTNLNIKLNDESLDLTYKYILDNLSNKNIEIYDSEKLIYSNSFSNNYIVVIDKNLKEVHISSAIYNAININTYTEGWKINTDDFTKRYSLYFYSDLDRSIKPFRMNGTGIGDIIFDNFDNIFYQDIRRGTWEEYRIFSLIVATLIYTILIFLLIKIISNTSFRTSFIKNSYVMLYIVYFFLLWGIFLLIGNYSPALVDSDIFLKTTNSWSVYNYVIPQITHYLAGYRGYILPTIVTYSFISIIMYYILLNLKINKILSFIFPIILLMLPNINYGLYAAMWPAIISGYLFVISSLLIFLLVYGKDNYKRYYILLSIISSIIALLYRSDYLPILFMTLFTSIIFIFYKYNNFNKMTSVISIILSIIICLFFLKVSSFTGRGLSLIDALYTQYLYAYVSPKFYKENTFTDEEKIMLKFDEPFKYFRYSVEVSNRLEGIQKYYKFEDYHPMLRERKTINKEIMKEILIKKFFQNPYPVIYARIQSFKYYILPYFNYISYENIHFGPLYSQYMDYNIDTKRSKIYNDLLDKIVSRYGERINKLFWRFFGFINIIIIIFLLLNFKKAPITAYINISSLMYYFILFLTSIVPSYYHYGPYLLGILSIILYIYESRYVENKFDVSILKKLIKKG